MTVCPIVAVGEQAGRALYPTATRLLVTADAGGSNSYRLWKTEVARFAAAAGLHEVRCDGSASAMTRSLCACTLLSGLKWSG